jgi:hypothetical protein
MNEKVFIPAQPVITPSAKPEAAPMAMRPASAQAATPPSVTKRVSSRTHTVVGAPSKSPPPHVVVRSSKPAAPAPVKREYAWQKNRALGKKF